MTLPRSKMFRIRIGFRQNRNKQPPGGSVTLPYGINSSSSINCNLTFRKKE